MRAVCIRMLFMLSILISLTSFLSCQQTKQNMDMIVIDNSYRFSYDDKNFGQVLAEGGTRTAQLYMAIPLPWQLSSLPDWVACTPSKGTHSTEIQFSVAKNNLPLDRIAVYYLSVDLPNYPAKVESSLSQKAAEPYLSMSPIGTMDIDHKGASIRLNLSSNISWRMETDLPEVVSLSTMTGQGDAEVMVTIAPFDIIDRICRVLTISLHSTYEGFTHTQSLTITQPSKHYKENVKQLVANFPWTESSGRYIDLGNTQSFTARSNDTWISITPENGNGPLNLLVAALHNTSFSPRTGHAYVYDSEGNITYEFKVNQEAVVCELSQTQLSFECNDQEAKTVSVQTNAQWHVSTTADWLNFDRNSINEGNHSLTINADEWLSTSDRTAIVTLSLTENPALTRQIEVRQFGTNLIANDKFFQFGPEGGKEPFSILGTSLWITRCEQEWISVSPTNGKGAGVLSIQVQRNPLTTSRVGYIYLSDEANSYTLTIHQLSTELNIDASDLTFESKGGSKQLTISSNDVWSASTNESGWLSISSRHGAGNVELIISALLNETAQPRKGTVVISANGQQRSATIHQKESIINTSASKVLFFKEGGTQIVDIQSDSTPSVSSSQEWVNAFIENNHLCIEAATNLSDKDRTATITLSLYNGAVIRIITVLQYTGITLEYFGQTTIDLNDTTGTSVSVDGYGGDSTLDDTTDSDVDVENYNEESDLNDSSQSQVTNHGYGKDTFLDDSSDSDASIDGYGDESDLNDTSGSDIRVDGYGDSIQL